MRTVPIPPFTDTTTEADIVTAARAFVRGMTSAELVRIPEACRPRTIVDGDDVIFVYVCLKQERILRADAGLAIGPELEALVEFFRVAARRIRQCERAGRSRVRAAAVWW